MHCTTQPGAERGSEISFSLCAVPNYLVLVSKYFGCIPGTLRIPEVLGEVHEFGSKSRTTVSSREGSIEVEYEARSQEGPGFSESLEQRVCGESGWGQVVNDRNQS